MRIEINIAAVRPRYNILWIMEMKRNRRVAHIIATTAYDTGDAHNAKRHRFLYSLLEMLEDLSAAVGCILLLVDQLVVVDFVCSSHAGQSPDVDCNPVDRMVSSVGCSYKGELIEDTGCR